MAAKVALHIKAQNYMNAYEALSLILRFNLTLWGYSIWSAIFIAPHTEDYF
jgi:hypothetical protein